MIEFHPKSLKYIMNILPTVHVTDDVLGTLLLSFNLVMNYSLKMITQVYGT